VQFSAIDLGDDRLRGGPVQFYTRHISYVPDLESTGITVTAAPPLNPTGALGPGGLAAVVLSRVCPKGRDEGAPLTGSGRPRIISRRVEGRSAPT
jgi:hypothetical protein